MSLVIAIMKELDRQARARGIKKLCAESYQLNAITEGATKIVEEFGREKKEAKAAMGMDAWLQSDDTGLSSKAMAMAMFACGNGQKDYPHDPSDFGRCYRFLEAVPEARSRLTMMRDVSPVWARLVDAWDELTALYLEESPTGVAPKLYARMKELINAKP